jgi:hypothetical protein
VRPNGDFRDGLNVGEPKEFAIQLLFLRCEDGRFRVHSPDVPGLHLAGSDLAAIRTDIEPIIKDLLYFNSKLIIDQIHWVPSLEGIVAEMAESKSAPPTKDRSSEFLVIVGRAA